MDFLQVFVLRFIISSFGIINVEPLFQGFSVKKEFDVSFKPFVLKPISIIKEIFSPFGTFGIKHGIEKRELNTVEPAPVVEYELHEEPYPVSPFLITPAPEISPEDPNVSSAGAVVTSLPLLTPKPISLPEPSHLSLLHLITPQAGRPVTSFRPGTSFVLSPGADTQSISIPLFTPEVLNSNSVLQTNEMSLATPKPVNVLNTPIPLPMLPPGMGTVNMLNSNSELPQSLEAQVITPLTSPLETVASGPLPINILSSSIPPLSPTFSKAIITSLGSTGESVQVPVSLNTDISRAEIISNYLKEVENQSVSPKPDIKDIPPLENNNVTSDTTNNSLFSNSAIKRGTRLALYFSNIFVNLLSQFLSSAQSTLAQLPELKLSE